MLSVITKGSMFVLLQDWVCQAESSRLQQALCINIYQGFVFAYESLLASQVRLLT